MEKKKNLGERMISNGKSIQHWVLCTEDTRYNTILKVSFTLRRVELQNNTFVAQRLPGTSGLFILYKFASSLYKSMHKKLIISLQRGKISSYMWGVGMPLNGMKMALICIPITLPQYICQAKGIHFQRLQPLSVLNSTKTTCICSG